MKVRSSAVGLAALSLLLAGCTAAPAPRVTVTVTAPAATPTLAAGDAAPWDLHAVCAAESGISTLEQWRDQQTTAGRLTSAQAAAVLQGIAVEYQNMAQYGVPSSVEAPVTTLANASGTLEHPRIDLRSTDVETARTAIGTTCRSAGLTIGVYAQGG